MTSTIQNNVTLNAFREAFEAGSRNLEQMKSFQEFCKVGLPTNKSEEYRFTPIGKFLEANFDLSMYGQASVVHAEVDSNSKSCSVNIVNGRLQQNESEPAVEGIHIAETESSSTAHTTDPFALLNQSFNGNEIHIRVAANTYASKTILIKHIVDSEAEQVMLNPRIILDMEENSSCSIVETFESAGINPVFTNIVSEFRLQGGSHLNYYRLQDDAGAYQVYYSNVKQLGKCTINSFVFSFDGSVIRNNSIFSIESEHCESNFYGLYFPSGKSLIDNHTVADHRMPNCVSNEMYKGIISDSAKGIFNGKIWVRPNAQKTNAFQSNRNILLSDAASINTKPQLEIWADDVKCSHGCTTGQLDTEAMFYLQSRGISQENARTMLLSAFASEVVEKISDSKLKEEITRLVAERLRVED